MRILHTSLRGSRVKLTLPNVVANQHAMSFIGCVKRSVAVHDLHKRSAAAKVKLQPMICATVDVLFVRQITCDVEIAAACDAAYGCYRAVEARLREDKVAKRVSDAPQPETCLGIYDKTE